MPPRRVMEALRALDAEALHCWAFRVADWFALNLLDDPAWLALMFC